MECFKGRKSGHEVEKSDFRKNVASELKESESRPLLENWWMGVITGRWRDVITAVKDLWELLARAQSVCAELKRDDQKWLRPAADGSSHSEPAQLNKTLQHISPSSVPEGTAAPSPGVTCAEVCYSPTAVTYGSSTILPSVGMQMGQWLCISTFLPLHILH